MNKEEIKDEDISTTEDEQTQEVEEDTSTKDETQTEVVQEDEYAGVDEKFKAQMEAKVKEAEDKYLRTHAEFENIKKRLEKEKYQAIDYASEKFAKDLLTTIDTLEMALQSANADLPAEELIEKLKEGIELTIKNLKTTFEKHDVCEVHYDEFDPNYHNAVMQNPSDEHNDGDIIQVLQKGYQYKERLLRPAMVNICKK